MRLSGRTSAVVAYAAGAALSIVAAVWLLELWRADLRVPFDYSGDALFFALGTKTPLEQGWFWTNPNVGAPGGFDLYDFPVVAGDSFHLLMFKLLSVFSSDW